MAEIISICASSSVPRNAAEMFQNEKIPDKPHSNQLLIYTIKFDESIVRYGKLNKFEHSKGASLAAYMAFDPSFWLSIFFM